MSSPVHTLTWDDDGAITRDVETAKRIAAHLERRYPGHQWAVHVSHQYGHVFLRLPALTSIDGGLPAYIRHKYRDLAYYIPMGDLVSDPNWHSITFGGGTLLEFWNQARARLRPEDIPDALPSTAIKDLKRGQLIGNA